MYQLIAHHEYDALAYLLNEAPEINAHFTTMLIRHGFQNEHMQTWVRFKGAMMIAACAIYRESAIVYERERPSYKDVLDLLNWHTVKSISGPSYVIYELMSQRTFKSVEHTTVARLDSLAGLNVDQSAIFDEGGIHHRNLCLALHLEPYKKEDLKEKIILQNQVFDLKVPVDHQGIHHLFDKKILRGYLIRENDEVVATGEWLNNHPTFGHILGIATHKNYRRKHYAYCISEKLCEDIVIRGKTPLLRYENQAAGALYHQLGFVDIGEFSTLYLF